MSVKLPPGWRWNTLSEIGEIVGGGTPTASDPDNFDVQGVPWITPADLSGYSGTYIERGERSLSPVGYQNSGAKLMPPGAVLYSSRAPIGYCVIARGPVSTNQGFKSLVLKQPGLLPEYVRFYLISAKQYIESLASGTTFKEISGRRMAEVLIPVAPLGEQRHIVAAIEADFSRLDAAEQGLKRVQAKLKHARASVLKAAVEGRLVPTEAALARAEGRRYEPGSALLARVLAERRARWAERGERGKYKEPVAPETEGLPELPEGWVWTSLDSLANVSGGFAKDAKNTDGRLVPYLRVANVQKGRLNLEDVRSILATEDRIQQLRLEVGDVLMNEGGDRDKLGRGWVWNGELPECIHQNHVFRARMWSKVFDSRYISHYANSQGDSYFMDQGKQTTNLASISMSRVKMLPVALPPAAEANRIVAEVDRRLSVLDQVEALVGRSLTRCASLRQSILKRAFEGRLVPPSAEVTPE